MKLVKTINRFYFSLKNAFRLFVWAFNNPDTLNESTFKMLSDLLTMILKVANENRHMMSHIAFVHPDDGEKQIVSIWAGAGLGAEPTKRISEFLSENSRLKSELSRNINSENKI